MSQPIGDKIFNFSCTFLGCLLVGGWAVFLMFLFFKWVFPRYDDKLTKGMDISMTVMGKLTKYSLYILGALFVLRLLAGWLGWAPPLNSTGEPGDF